MSNSETFPGCFSMCLMDIGAAGGIHPRWGDLANSNLTAILIEPEAKAFSQLDKVSGHVHSIAAALSSEDGRHLLHVARKGRCSSLYPRNFDFVNRFPNQERFEIVGEEEVKTRTLDGLCSEIGQTAVDFIKIDVEGHESAVITGGETCFRNAIGIEAEMVFAPLYIGGTGFCDQHASYSEMGFELFGLQRYHWKRKAGEMLPSPGQITYCNGLYLKSPETLVTESAGDARRLRAAFRIYASFGLNDLVVVLQNLCSDQELLPTDDLDRINAYLSHHRFAKSHGQRAGILHRALMKFASWVISAARYLEPTERERHPFPADQALGRQSTDPRSFI